MPKPENGNRVFYPDFNTEEQTFLASPLDSISPPPYILPAEKLPLPTSDDRILCLSFARVLEDDGPVVEFCSTLSSLVKCKTAAVMLRAGQNARTTLLYLVNYLGKNNVQLSECLWCTRGKSA